MSKYPKELGNSLPARGKWVELQGAARKGADRDMVLAYCSTLGLWSEATAHVRAEGLLVQHANGMWHGSPWLKIVDEQAKHLRLLAVELRNRKIEVDGEPEDSRRGAGPEILKFIDERRRRSGRGAA